MEKINFNYMLLGGTGVGKSAVINYLADKKVVETGVGKPVTRKGEFNKHTILYPLNPKVTMTFYDSWGLESDKAEEWENFIIKTLNESYIDSDPNENFLGVIYCMSYSNDRIQDWEIKFLNKIMEFGYHIIILFTHGDNSGYQEKKVVFRDILKKEFKESIYCNRYSAVDISSISITKIGQAESKPFGKDELLKQIDTNDNDNFWVIIENKLDRWKNKTNENFREFYKTYKNKAENFECNFWDNNTEKANDLKQEIENAANKVFKESVENIVHEMSSVTQWYNKIKDSSTEMGVKIDKSKPFWANYLLYLRPLANFSRENTLRNSFTEYVESIETEFIKKIDDIYKNTFEQVKKLYYNKSR
jgi:GTP-binding protein EngB required for normal cell division